MNKTLGSVLAAALLASGLQFAAASPADAKPSNKNCVTKREFKKVKAGMSYDSVRRRLGAKGRVTSDASLPDGDSWRTYSYRQCGRTWQRSVIMISFELTPYTVHVPDIECFDGTCYDWGIDETRYRAPYIVSSKAAYWN